jgi:hypothetical protein
MTTSTPPLFPVPTRFRVGKGGGGGMGHPRSPSATKGQTRVTSGADLMASIILLSPTILFHPPTIP